MPEQFAVQVSVRPTNHDPGQLLDISRRQVDYLGPWGFPSRRQPEGRGREPKWMPPAQVFPSRELARAYQDRVAALGYNELETKRFRIAPKPPFRLALKGRGKR